MTPPRRRRRRSAGLAALAALLLASAPAAAQVAVRGKTVHTMSGPALRDGIVLVRDGKIAAVGPAASIPVPDGFRVLQADVVTPGLVDAHSIVGLSGEENQPHDQDQLDSSAPIQPELRAVDAYNPRERLVEWVRSFGVTTIHTGHAPGELIPGQTMVVKTAGRTADEAILLSPATVAVTLGEAAIKGGDKSPGTRGKMVAMLRRKLVEASEYARRSAADDPEKAPPRDIALEVLVRVLRKEVPLLITAQRAHDIASAFRLADEFGFRPILDGAAEVAPLLDDVRRRGVPVVLHPPMARTVSELENASYETAAKLRKAGVPFAFQSGYEGYVPKTRVVLLEAAIAAANGLAPEEALAAITIDAARILGVDSRVGSLAVGKDGDLALYDGDPFEYTTHCIGVVIDGKVVSEIAR